MRSKGSHGVFAPSALRCPKKSSRCSLARFFRPLRVLRLAASATGGARLRTPYPFPDAGKGDSIRSPYIKNAPAAPYKRRLIPLREAVLWLSGRGVPSRRGSRGTPRVTFAYFSSEKSRPPPARRTGCYPVVTMRRRRRLQAGSKYLLLLFLGEKQARGSVYNLRLA